MSQEVPKTNLEQHAIETLKKYWGYEQFRPNQLEIVCSVLKGKDTFYTFNVEILIPIL